MIGFYTNLYYNAVIMYTIYYFFASLQKVSYLHTLFSVQLLYTVPAMYDVRSM